MNNFSGYSTENLKKEKQELGRDIAQSENSLAAMRMRHKILKNEIERRLTAETAPSVSDHAVLRYMERIHGIDVEAVRKEILTPENVDYIRAGMSAIKAGGVKFHIKNHCVTTVVT